MNLEHKNLIYDKWLTRVIQRYVYNIIIDDQFIRKTRDQASAEYVLLKELQSKPVFLYSRVSTDYLSAVKFLENWGFHLIDTTVAFNKPITLNHRFTGHSDVRFAIPEDCIQVVDLARKSFVYSRFHLDSTFAGKVADSIKAEWVNGYFTKTRGNAMVVALVDEIIIGFLLLLYSEDALLTIDLIAVDENHRGKGVAKDMIIYAESQCQGFTQIRTGTQLANVASIRLYEGMGFKIAATQYTFHYHNR